MASVTVERAPVPKALYEQQIRSGCRAGSSLESPSVRLEFDGKSSGREAPVMASTLSGLLGPVDSVCECDCDCVVKMGAVATVKHDRRCDYETMLRLTVVYKMVSELCRHPDCEK